MDMSDLRGLSTILCMIAFLAVCFWAYAPSRKKYFEDAAAIPFLGEEPAVEEDGEPREKDQSP